MLNKKTLAEQLDRIAMNYSLDMKKGYTKFIGITLNQYNFTDRDFLITVDNLIKNETQMFARMPNIAMFLKYKPKIKENIKYFKALPKPKKSKAQKLSEIKTLQDLENRLRNRNGN